MFRTESNEISRSHRLAVAGLMGLNVAALAVTIWVMADFSREQQIVRELIRQLPPQATASAELLAGELKRQFRLTALVVLNLIATGFAVALLARAYRTSQRSLHDVKNLAGDILSSMDQAVITTDREGVITSINRRGLELLGVGEDSVGHKLGEACKVVDLETFRRESIPKDPSRVVKDYVVAQPQGNRILRAFCQPLRDVQDHKIGTVLQLRDVTERALTEQQMQRMERFMGLGSLSAGLHHEIKNPLSALSLHVQLFEEQFESQQLPDETRETLGVLKTEVARIIGVLESFRSYASIDRLTRTAVYMDKLLERQVRLISPQASACGVKIRTEIESPIPRLKADRGKLEQVMLNLMINAMDAMPGGGRLTISAAVQENYVVVRVADTGHGISDDMRPHLFDPYFTTKGSGTGLGLALSEKIVRQHGGILELCPSDQGAVFAVSIPIEGT